MKHFNALPLLSITLIALSVVAGCLAGCGDAACPAGSQRVGGQCMPVLVCPDGEERDGNECVAVDAGTDGGDGDGDGDGNPGDGDGDGDGDAGNQSDAGDAGGDPDASDSDADAPDPLCADVDCGDHGDCEVADDEARCACDNDYAGEHCETCEPGLGLLDGECVPGCEAEDAPECGDHGECDVVDDEAQCVCEHPFGDDDCEGCAEGYALQGNGTCEADCGTCGAHSYCDATPLVPACACVAGYADSGSGCEWVGDGTTGGILDGEFNNPDAWTTEHVSLAGGVATFQKDGVGNQCELGSLSQTITMPDLADAEPLVLVLNTQTPCSNSDPEMCPPLLVELGDSLKRVLIPGGSTPGSRIGASAVCLGEGAYGGEVDLRIRPGLTTQHGQVALSCESDAWPTVTAMRIRAAGSDECPEVDEIAGAALNSASKWSLASATVSGGQLNVGNNGLAFTKVHVPAASALGSASLQYTATSNFVGAIVLDGMILRLLVTGGEPFGAICLPDWALGSVHDLGFYPINGTMVISELALARESACGDGSFDGGFERSDTITSWNGYTAPLAISTSMPHSGNRSLQAGTNTVQTSALVRFPVRGADQELAFTFWHRLSGDDMQGNYSITGALIVSGSYTERPWAPSIACMGHAWSAQPAVMSFSASAAMTSGTGTPLTFIDDIGPILISDGFCP